MNCEEDVTFIKRKGGTVLLHNGFQFYKVKDFKNGSSLWRCSTYKKDNCRGNISIKDNRMIKRRDHSCSPNLAKNLIAKEFERLKESVKDGIDSVPQLYNEMVSTIQTSTFDMVADVPSLTSCQHSLYSARNKSLGIKKSVYKNFNEVCVPSKFTDFILADYNNHDGSRIIVFCSQVNREKLSEVVEYFADATFDTCPPPFYQLYTIHGDVGSTITATKTVPLIYALMPNKKQDTYKIVFELIKAQLPGFKPCKLHCDYEIAAINAALEAFPGVMLVGCYYHWCKAIWKKSKKLSLKSKTEKRLTGLISALPLLPKEYITEGREYIQMESLHKPKMVKFLKYIDSFWMTKNFIDILCVFGQRHRTNNVTESYHSQLGKKIRKYEITVTRLLTVLKALESKSFIKQRKRIYTDNDDDILFVQMQLINKEISTGVALEKLR